MFEVRYTNKQLCTCGRYVGSKKDGIVVMSCRARLPLNFTVQISVEKVRNRWGENCTFFFVSPGSYFAREHVLRILPENIVTSQTSESLITLNTGNIVTPTPNPPAAILQSAVPSIPMQSPLPSVQRSLAFLQTSPSSSEVSSSSSVSSDGDEKGRFNACDL